MFCQVKKRSGYGLREEYQKRYARHVLRLSRSNVASLDNRHALKNLLKASRPQEDTPGDAWRLYERWKQINPLAVVREFEQRIKSLYPSLYGELLYQCYLGNLPDH